MYTDSSIYTESDNMSILHCGKILPSPLFSLLLLPLPLLSPQLLSHLYY